MYDVIFYCIKQCECKNERKDFRFSVRVLMRLDDDRGISFQFILLPKNTQQYKRTKSAAFLFRLITAWWGMYGVLVILHFIF